VELFNLVIGTLLLRPYVFFFLAVALGVSVMLMGRARTAVFFCTTWAIAFVSEISSTRIGFPFGDYYYIDITRDQELWIFNVPFMDSISFSFLLFASYCCANLILYLAGRGKSPSPVSGLIMAITVLLFVFIDVIIDPVALRGDRWFLGKIYGYTEPGIYFGVPLSNFAGWAFVGFTSLLVFRIWEPRLANPKDALPPDRTLRFLYFGTGLYYLVLIFNLAVTFWIGEFVLGVVGTMIYLPLSLWILMRSCASSIKLEGHV
jgi:putative membrane protein